MSLALWATKVLRKIPHTARFDTHLDDCAALEVIYGPYDSALPLLRLSHVIRLSKLPIFQPTESQPVWEGTEAPRSADNVVWIRSRKNMVVIDSI